jgi:hypothetical protein
MRPMKNFWGSIFAHLSRIFRAQRARLSRADASLYLTFPMPCFLFGCRRRNGSDLRNYVADAPRKYHPGRGGRRDPLAIGRTGLPSEYRARPARILCTSVLGEIPRA